jgi:predicted nuclease with TOPRIM domain
MELSSTRYRRQGRARCINIFDKFFVVIVAVGIAIACSLTTPVSAFFFQRSSSTTTTASSQVATPIDKSGIPPHQKERYAADTFTCDGGKISLPKQYVNDDYCDCQDGSDEPGTSACGNGYFHCLNKGYRITKQPSSKVNDGVCDCCDGSDEWASGKCANTCALIAASEMVELEKLRNGYMAGHKLIEEKIKELTDNHASAAKSLEVAENNAALQSEHVSKLQGLHDESQQHLDEMFRKRRGDALDQFIQTTHISSMDLPKLVSFALAVFRIGGVTPDEVSAAGNNVHGNHYDDAEVNFDGTVSGYKDTESDDYGTPYDDSGEVVAVEEDHRDSGELDYPNCRFTEGSSELSPLLISLCNAAIRNDDDNHNAERLVKEVLFTVVVSKKYVREVRFVNAYFSTHGNVEGIDDIVQRVGALDVVDALQLFPDFADITQKLEGILGSVEETTVETPFFKDLNEARERLEALDAEKEELQSSIRLFQQHFSNLNYLATRNECSEVTLAVHAVVIIQYKLW